MSLAYTGVIWWTDSSGPSNASSPPGPALPCPVATDIDTIQDCNAFGERIAAPLRGFAGVFDYYNRASCRGYLPAITTPTLNIHALDDPFMFPASVPFEQELGPGVTLELSPNGGHVGFVASILSWRAGLSHSQKVLLTKKPV